MQMRESLEGLIKLLGSPLFNVIWLPLAAAGATSIVGGVLLNAILLLVLAVVFLVELIK